MGAGKQAGKGATAACGRAGVRDGDDVESEARVGERAGMGFLRGNLPRLWLHWLLLVGRATGHEMHHYRLPTGAKPQKARTPPKSLSAANRTLAVAADLGATAKKKLPVSFAGVIHKFYSASSSSSLPPSKTP